MDALFVCHARTVAEMRDSFLSDLRVRLERLDTEDRYEERVGRKAAIARARAELTELMSFWSKVELPASKSTRISKP